METPRIIRENIKLYEKHVEDAHERTIAAAKKAEVVRQVRRESLSRPG